MAVMLVFGVALLWCFWPSLVELSEIWEGDPQYSHGFLVPVFAVVMLWMRREHCDLAAFKPAWSGVMILLAGCALRIAGGYYYYFWLERIALLPVLIGITATLGGWAALRWSWSALAFLFFMLPLPSGLSQAMGQPLQRIGTLASSYLLEIFGFPALTEGNVILLREVDLGIVEACSGLRMLITFFAASAAVAILVKESLWIRIPLFLSAVPIAVVVNIIRITSTAILHDTVGSKIANLVFHDLAGWLMIPMALGFLWLTYIILRRLIVVGDPNSAAPLKLTIPKAIPARSAKTTGKR